VTGSQHTGPNQRPHSSGKSYFWAEASIAAGVLAGIFVLGLWGDVAIGGVILGLQLLCAGAGLAARKLRGVPAKKQVHAAARSIDVRIT
jgi:hypothetical protein